MNAAIQLPVPPTLTHPHVCAAILSCHRPTPSLAPSLHSLPVCHSQPYSDTGPEPWAGRRGALPLVVPAKAGTQGPGRGGAGSLSLIPSHLCALRAPTHRRRGRPLHFTPPSATLSQCRRPQPSSQPPSRNTSPTSAPSGHPAAPPASAPTTLRSATCSTPSEPPSSPRWPASPSSPTTARATPTSDSTPPAR